MTLNYLKKLDKIRDEMFNISLGLKEMFDFAMDCHDKQAVEKTIKEIKKIQKKCYKVIDRKRLNDNHGGTYRCYPGGDVDVYKPHTDRQNVVDIIDYFFYQHIF